MTARDVVVAVALLGDRVLLVETPNGEVLPGGKVEAGETHDAALARELREETGFTLERVVGPLGVEARRGVLVHFYAVEVAALEMPRPGGDAVRAWWAAPGALQEPASAFPQDGARVARAAVGRAARRLREGLPTLAKHDDVMEVDGADLRTLLDGTEAVVSAAVDAERAANLAELEALRAKLAAAEPKRTLRYIQRHGFPPSIDVGDCIARITARGTVPW